MHTKTVVVSLLRLSFYFSSSLDFVFSACLPRIVGWSECPVRFSVDLVCGGVKVGGRAGGRAGGQELCTVS